MAVDACASRIRDRLSVKLDGLSAYVQAIGVRLDAENGDASARVHMQQRVLRDALERLEREADGNESLALTARAALRVAIARLQTLLTTRSSDEPQEPALRMRALAAAMAELETQLNAVGVAGVRNGAATMDQVCEWTVRAMLRLQAEIETAAVGVVLGKDKPRPAGVRSLAKRLRLLSETIASARRLAGDDAKLVEPRIASGVERARAWYASLSG